ncbi:MAG TPA: Bax inhibitor-1/YccA family protein [Gammaproteobacteria bacterium]|jgi:FtsH-binding integral membrane protein|nr:Bax inhibitor-1/YccA family protein [Gammaproteobacteria bacterium]
MNLRNGNSQSTFYTRGRSVDISAFMSRVYAWMMLGILVTGIVAFEIGNNPELVGKVFGNKVFFWAVLIAQFGAVIYLSMMINRISAAAAGITFLMYSALTGITMSMIFVLYTQQSIALAFGTTAIGFGGLSAFGMITKRDLGPIGSFCMMGLFGLIGLMLLSFLIPSLASDSMQLTFSVAGLIIFAGLTAYDTQRIKGLAGSGMAQQAIYGALILYLDFINLFINLLRLMGDRR